MKKRIHIYNATECPRRTLDSSNLHKFLTENDYLVVDDPQLADDILLVTCAAWDLPELNSVKKLEELKTYNKNLVLMGCLSVINKELLDRHFHGTVIPPRDLPKINDLYPHKIPFERFNRGNDSSKYFHEAFELKKKRGVLLNAGNVYRRSRRLVKYAVHLGPIIALRIAADHLSGASEYSLKICEGCVWNCAYCGVKKAIGPLRSRPLNDCIEDFREAIFEKGHHRISIVADDTGSYGLDIGESFMELLDRITGIDAFFILNLGEMHPHWLIKHFDYMDRILARKKILSLVIPVQSASQRIIALMDRNYDICQVKELMVKLKKRHRYLHLNTHIIVGYPTEAVSDIDASISFIREAFIDSGSVLMYSSRPGTKSSRMEGQLSHEEKKSRMLEYHRRLAQSRYQVEFNEQTEYSIFFTR